MSGVRGDARKRRQESQPALEVGLTEAEREALDEQFGDAFTVAWERAVARIKAEACERIAQPSLPLDRVQAIVKHLISDGTYNGLILGNELNMALGASARRRAARLNDGSGA